MFRSLRWRMAVSHAAVLMVILIALGSLVQLLLARSLDRSATNDLLALASGQAEKIEETGQADTPFDPDSPSAATVRIAVFVEPQDVIVGSPDEVPAWLRNYPSRVTDLTVAGERVRIVTVPAVHDGITVAWVAAGRSLAVEEALRHRIRLLMLAGGSVALIASLLAGWWLAGRAVRPIEHAYAAQAGFAADASHELRTPLTFIRTGVEVLAEHDPDLGGEVLSEVDYLTGLTQRLLVLARAERDGVILDRAPFDLAEVCRSAARRSVVAQGNVVNLAGPEPQLVTGDRIALEAALDALLENVHVHGGGVADLRWGPRANEAIVSVVDHGPGISAAAAEHVFERFFRADPSRARRSGGAGLGSSVAHTVVAAQGGRIWLDPTPDGGLSVHIALPLA